jgi:hypothetical protein
MENNLFQIFVFDCNTFSGHGVLLFTKEQTFVYERGRIKLSKRFVTRLCDNV